MIQRTKITENLLWEKVLAVLLFSNEILKIYFSHSLWVHEKLFGCLNNGVDWFIFEKYSAELKGIHIIFHTLSLSPICLGKDISSKMIITTFWKESKDGGNPWGGFTTCKAGWLRVRMMHFYSCKQHWPHLHYSRLYSIPLHLLSPFIKSPMYEIDPKCLVNIGKIHTKGQNS